MKTTLPNVHRWSDDPEIDALVWKAAASFYGRINGKLVGPRNLKAEIIALLEVEARKILKEHRAQPRRSP